jgi:hypothetical protein
VTGVEAVADAAEVDSLDSGPTAVILLELPS